MIQRAVERMYTESDENRFLEVTYANGDKEILYFKDFNSGAMIENIVSRAKKMARKDLLAHRQRAIRVQHMLAACVDEFRENEDLPNTTNPDDWARISGKKGDVYRLEGVAVGECFVIVVRYLSAHRRGDAQQESLDLRASLGVIAASMLTDAKPTIPAVLLRVTSIEFIWVSCGR